jgi:hypothetical protein
MRCTKLISSSNLSTNIVMRAFVEQDPLGSAAIGIPRDRVLIGLLVCTSFFLGAILSYKDGKIGIEENPGYNVIANVDMRKTNNK